MADARGGRREGAGRKPGSKSVATKEQKATIGELARAHAPDALKALIEIAKQSQSDSARVAAANSILDRAYGKAPAISVGDDETPANSVAFDIRPATGDVRVTKPE